MGSGQQAIEPLGRDEVVKCIERRGDGKIPALMCTWWGNGTREKYGEQLYELEHLYPDDVHLAWFTAPGGAVSPTGNPSYRWGYQDDYSRSLAHSIGGDVELLQDWDDLQSFLDDFPNPREPGNMDTVASGLARAGNRYKLGGFWRLFHEKLWEIRGMTNLMYDYYDNMDGLKTIGRRLLEFHKAVVDQYAELGFDGIFTSDDLGHQSSSMMSPEVFHELYYPLYCEFISHAHNKGLHVWLHSCGNNTALMEDLIACGLDVFHPVQKNCMDARETAESFSERITFLYGIDVQRLLPNASADEIEREVAEAREFFLQEGGGLMFAAGNGIMPDTPLENIKAMLKAVYRYR